jgi:uncharacterized membrane protein YecN with MAPEG domain
MTHQLPITAIYAVPLALLFLVLSVRIILIRRHRRIAFGSGGDADLERRVRIHANFAEYTPFALLLLTLAESAGSPPLWLHLAGSSLVIGRFAHAIGLSRPSTDDLGRIVGMTGSQTSILITAILLLMTWS